MAAEIAAIVATTPVAGMTPDQINVSDPVMDAGLTSLVESREALEAGAEAQKLGDELAEATDVVEQATTSEMVDPVADLGWADDADAVSDADADVSDASSDAGEGGEGGDGGAL